MSPLVPGETNRVMTPWPLNKLIVFLLLSGLAMLSSQIRWDHRIELGRQWKTWIPLVYAGLMLVAGALSLDRWEGWGRRVLLVGFALGIVVGVVGVWFHGGKDPVGNLLRVFTAWWIPPGTNGGVKMSASGPPILAPLAFVGIGLIGLMSCSRRFRADS